jgi:hypothetical protein
MSGDFPRKIGLVQEPNYAWSSAKLHRHFTNAGKIGSVRARLADRVMTKRSRNHGLPRLQAHPVFMQEPAQTRQRQVGIIHRRSWSLRLDQLPVAVEFNRGINETISHWSLRAYDYTPLGKTVSQQHGMTRVRLDTPLVDLEGWRDGAHSRFGLCHAHGIAVQRSAND